MTAIILPEIRDDLCKLVLSYLDDNYLVFSSLSQAQKAYDRLVQISGQHGLVLNRKTELLSLRNITSEELENFPFLSKVQIRHRGFQVLGGFVGTNEYIEEMTQRAFEEIAENARQVADLVKYATSEQYQNACNEPVIQKALAFTRYCIPSRAIHLLRTTDPQITANYIQILDV
jgi:hypothetical protein